MMHSCSLPLCPIDFGEVWAPSAIVESLTEYDNRTTTLQHMTILLSRLLQGLVSSAVQSRVFRNCAASAAQFLRATQSGAFAVMGPMLERPRTYLGSAQAMLDTGHIDDDNTDTWEDLHGRLQGAVRGHFG